MKYTIGELAEIIDGDRGSNYPKQDEFFDTGFCLFLNTGNVTKDGFSFDSVQFITEEKDGLLKKGRLQRGDIVYTTRGTVGNAAFYSSSVPYEHVRINSGMVILRCRDEIVDTRFLYQVLKSEYYRPFFKKYCTGSAQPQLPIKNLSTIALEIPDKESQIHIADILSAYDSLIENNQKQIKLLEEAAQRLYKEWFIDLRFPGYETTPVHDGVPEGWEITEIGKVCETIGGGTPSTAKPDYYENGTIRWVTPTDLTKKRSIILLDTEKRITNEGLNNSSTKLLPPETILMTSRASIGYFALCEHEVCTNQGFISCVPFSDDLRYYLLFNLMNRVEEIKGKATGSTFREIAKRTFREMAFVIPTETLLIHFQKMIAPIVSQMRIIEKENETLIQARDRLLSKLMSGEIEV